MTTMQLNLVTLQRAKVSELAVISGEEIFEAASKWKPYLYSALQSQEAVEEVFSAALETVWMLRSNFDPYRGTLASFTGGVIRNLVMNYRDDVKPFEELPAAEGYASPPFDPDHSFEERLILRVIASHISPVMWSVMTARAYSTGTNKEKAAILGISVDQFRVITFRLSEVLETATSGVKLALSGDVIDDGRLHQCLPKGGGLREAAEHVDTIDGVRLFSDRAGIPRSTARRRISRAKELLGVVRLALSVVNDA